MPLLTGEEAAFIREIRNSQTIDATYVFELHGDSAVEVLVGEPTADRVPVGRKIFNR